MASRTEDATPLDLIEEDLGTPPNADSSTSGEEQPQEEDIEQVRNILRKLKQLDIEGQERLALDEQQVEDRMKAVEEEIAALEREADLKLESDLQDAEAELRASNSASVETAEATYKKALEALKAQLLQHQDAWIETLVKRVLEV